jgi:hypothetical protein
MRDCAASTNLQSLARKCCSVYRLSAANPRARLLNYNTAYYLDGERCLFVSSCSWIFLCTRSTVWTAGFSTFASLRLARDDKENPRTALRRGWKPHPFKSDIQSGRRPLHKSGSKSPQNENRVVWAARQPRSLRSRGGRGRPPLHKLRDS